MTTKPVGGEHRAEEPVSTEIRSGAEPTGARGFLVREWLFLLLVLWAVIMILFSLLLPSPLAEEGTEVLEAAPNSVEIMARLDSRPMLKRALFSFAGAGVLLFLAGLPLLAYFLWRRLEGVPILGAPSRIMPVQWGLWDVIKSGAVYFLLIQALGALLVLLGPGEAAADSALVAVFFGNLLTTLFIFVLVARRDPDWKLSLGLVAGRFWCRVRDGLVGYVAYFPLLVCTALVAVLSAHLLQLKPEQNPLVPMVLGSDSIWFLAFLLFFGGLVGPVTEEIFFRGFLYPPLRQRVGRVGAILINAFCFAALHGNLVQLAPLFGLGLILVVLRERTGSVLASTILHCTHNTLVLCLLFTLKPVLL